MIAPVRYSPLLLVQIPPPKSRQGPRWDTDVVVQIIRACLVEVNLEGIADEYPSFEIRCDLGIRLLTMVSGAAIYWRNRWLLFDSLARQSDSHQPTLAITITLSTVSFILSFGNVVRLPRGFSFRNSSTSSEVSSMADGELSFLIYFRLKK